MNAVSNRFWPPAPREAPTNGRSSTNDSPLVAGQLEHLVLRLVAAAARDGLAVGTRGRGGLVPG
jgi:hypothetical protein